MADTPGSEQSRREAKIVDRHLPDGYTAAPEAVDYDSHDTAEPDQQANGEQQESSLRLQGGDIHRDIFKIKARAAAPRRANTFSAAHQKSNVPITPEGDDVGAPLGQEPGGFRRQYVQTQGFQRRLSTAATPATRNFINFLEMYGSFAGEDLADTDEDDESAIDDGEAGPDEPMNERRPLLGRRKSTKRFRREGDASTSKTFFTLLKAFIGTGIMFLPKAFKNGGILFSSITLIMTSLITTLCFRLLLQCRKRYGGGGYGELGEAIVGTKLRSLILASITLSQIGFVCAGLIFTAENMLAFAESVSWRSGSAQPFGVDALIAIQFVVLVPLALIRNISKLGPAALLADFFILIGLVYIWYYDIATLAQRGIAPSVVNFNPSTFTLTIGSAIFTFEGIGLILPIQSSMKKPEHFSKLLYLVMFIVTVVFTSVGALCYATFGDETKIQIISNFPQTSRLVNAVQFIYSLAVLVGEPVQLYPAIRIIETSIFGDKASGKKSAPIKWKKNLLRSCMMLGCGVIAILGASDLDKFVALIGSFACVPLVYIYPPLLHYMGNARRPWEKALDLALMTLGVGAMAYTSLVTLSQWVQN
ncbi:vacuolar amino acid transporter 3 [Hortaea werneckii]|nr:vacuolar amino acid transporter 3 [Hortaea werneckii]KAI6992706.1 vacuolar amino acid transporter 3 [Hortaea werneckii]KAI7145134.1 vacuolar amino acid transporter 3 [Hortaea werneckii]KAI7173508.1 vacuolar amino acid transporter 3 [Hortaea werneckii]